MNAVKVKFSSTRPLSFFCKEVTWVILESMSDRIKWPATEFECRKISYGFSKLSFPYRMPNVAGCADGTLIDIVAPSNSHGAYISRYGRSALNVLGASFFTLLSL